MRALGDRGALAALAVVLVVTVASQWATEQYIPIGESPGVSGRTSFRGTIVSVDEQERTVTVSAESERVVAEITDETHVWVDRSELGESSTVGSFSDLKQGLEVEILSEQPSMQGEGPCDWIKVRAPRE